MGNGQLLFPYVTKVSSRTQLTGNIYPVSQKSDFNLKTKLGLYDMAERFLIQMHQGEYICRADNGVGPGQEAMVKLYIQGGILTDRNISLVL